jgi:hypothetical protein
LIWSLTWLKYLPALSGGQLPKRSGVEYDWQVDHHGAYLHTGSANHDARDKNFQGFGRFLTGSTGEYYFRTIKPVPYPGRTPHIHFMVKSKGQETFTTQWGSRPKRDGRPKPYPTSTLLPRACL